MPPIWYLYNNGDPMTNNAIVQVIGEAYVAECRVAKRCADGVVREVYRCRQGYEDVRAICHARTDFNLKFDVFCDHGDGILVRFDLWKRTLRKKGRHQRILNAFRLAS